MDIMNLLKAGTTSARLEAKNGKEVLESISALACANDNLGEVGQSEVKRLLREREELASTALGGGVALPHCRIPGIKGFTAGLVTTGKKIDFGAPDDEKVDIFAFLIGPEEKPREHLKILSGMARTLRNPGTRKLIREADSSDKLFSVIEDISSHTDSLAIQDRKEGMKLLHVFVRDHRLFDDILQVFIAGEFVGAMVLEAHESTEYLSGMPVFAGFWNDDLKRSSRIIVAAVKGTLLYQTLRNIEYVCGDLKDQSDVMVTVSDLHHVIGSLEFHDGI